jgi:dipeptidyl aminopeptidase/acylaminoacyl peptidase
MRLKAWVNLPKGGDSKRPGVLFLHGGFAFGPEDWETSQPFRDAGYVVLMPILRGENGQPGAFTFFYDEVDDVLAAAECLSQQPHVDADHLFIAGPSAGGTLALLAAMTSKRFHGVASFSATPDQVLFCKHAKHASRDVPIDITNRRELQMRSPLAYATSFKCPARVFYGSLEPEWKQTSQLMADLAKKHGLDVEAVQVEGDHGTSVRPAIDRAIAFFRDK